MEAITQYVQNLSWPDAALALLINIVAFGLIKLAPYLYGRTRSQFAARKRHREEFREQARRAFSGARHGQILMLFMAAQTSARATFTLVGATLLSGIAAAVIASGAANDRFIAVAILSLLVLATSFVWRSITLWKRAISDSDAVFDAFFDEHDRRTQKDEDGTFTLGGSEQRGPDKIG